MQAKFILRRPDDSRAQLAITADATATVAELAQALAAGDPDQRQPPPGTGLTLKVEHTAFDRGAAGRLLDPARSLTDSGLQSGSTVSLAAAPTVTHGRRRGRTAAVARILDGPDAGLEFPLPQGNSSVGTGLTNDVTLTDHGLTDVHAAITVGESIEIVNLAGPSGVCIGGQPVQRAIVGAGDVVQLAATSLAILPTLRPGTTQTDSVAIEFNRSPRVVARFDEHEFTAPRPPQPPEPARFPIISVLAPLIMGLILFAVTRSMLAVVFIALSPVLMVGMYIDTKLQARRRQENEAKRFADSLRALAGELTEAQRVERAVRLAEAPALGQVVEAIHRLGPLLWTHRPEHPAFLTVRLGLGDAASRCRIRLSDNDSAEIEHTAQLNDLQSRFSTVEDVPIVANLRESGALGICGPRGVVDGVARGIVMQLAGLHSPADLAITAFSSPQSRASWQWLEWMPHTGSIHSPLSGNHLTDSANGGQALLSRLEDLVKQRAARETLSGDDTLVVPAVIVLVEDTAPIDRSRLTRLAEQGGPVGVYVVWVATQVESLPAACRTFVLIENESEGATVGHVRHGRHTFPVACESIEVADARQVALLLAPVVDVGAAVEDATDLPRSVSYLTLAGTRMASDPAAVVAQWVSNESVLTRIGRPRPPAGQSAGLRALVGSTGAQELHLDLREHGPHALVGGTTGSGKSEFLQSWIMGMAAAHSPDRVSFLLVDYKGGTAFADCVGLPHTVGLVTDLTPHLVRRALTSLGAEIRRREQLLNVKRAKDLISLEQTGDPDTPPSLIIIVDEFAALASEVPEFVDGVIDVAQRGRSLGLHLVLATQRPAGVIRENLRANTNLRIALRLNDIDDSLDVIDDPIAASFPPEIPGRAVARTGPGRLTAFQAAYVGGWTSEQPAQAPIEISEFVFGRRRPWHNPTAAKGAVRPSGPTDIARMVGTVRAATQHLRIPLPRRPWLPPLQATYALEDLAPQSDGPALVIGTCDVPTEQTQTVETFSPDDAGNMAIIGTGGAGKSTALRTLAISAALNPHDGPAHVYGLDFASGSLKMLEALPHVAAVVGADDEERMGRILRRLTALLENRARRFARVNASTLTEYRRLADPDEPRVLLLVDAIGPFREQYEHVSHTPFFAMLSQLASDGRMLGIHVVITADRPAAIPSSLASTIQRRLVLRLASDDDYVLAGVSGDILSATSPQGRAILDGRELQVAVFGGDANVAVQARAIERLAEQMRRDRFAAPKPVERLSDRIEFDALPVSTPTGAAVIGVADESLAPLGITPAGVFMVTGPPGSGRSTALVTLAQAVRRQHPSAQIVHLAPSVSTIAGLDVWSSTATGQDPVIDLVNRLTLAPPPRGTGELMVVIEGIADFGGTAAENELARLIKTIGDAALVVGESEVSGWGQAWLLAQPFKTARRGMLLWPSGVEADSLFNTSIGVIRRSDFPPGRGVLIERGKGVWMQVAQPVI
ncbi:FtsK/SpoIIIE domain-containing protein [Mycolicibacterium monacense]|uniref:Cell division protein FtsK n=2 Tax=Mycobacteriaceae TaxID=1762 RepID=A0AAD1IXW0_MYCMB|nr:FtsK/SpoIIIE domain-containing protein [Mycolicibacterium monacense]MDA4100363.1 cell division protein FtsK [Mycolicibacterium monacense DSM 44395]ORB22486.1 cell division protein FtsK [Mycolicibacterium monacense DSM 44395]QHP84645.1 cell division protein FtsK [Mycolicibacterium monacense DSM 44395]BBZ62579.1 cell division protein FtsK [Mycolicibacterium monacense]